jgi:beta-1,4-mannosyltransferase
MKVVDMFGCQLPALARRYRCIDELVLDGQNGHVFSTAEELSGQMTRLLADWPQRTLLRSLAANIRLTSWDEAWRQTCLPSLR